MQGKGGLKIHHPQNYFTPWWTFRIFSYFFCSWDARKGGVGFFLKIPGGGGLAGEKGGGEGPGEWGGAKYFFGAKIPSKTPNSEKSKSVSVSVIFQIQLEK